MLNLHHVEAPRIYEPKYEKCQNHWMNVISSGECNCGQ